MKIKNKNILVTLLIVTLIVISLIVINMSTNLTPQEQTVKEYLTALYEHDESYINYVEYENFTLDDIQLIHDHAMTDENPKFIKILKNKTTFEETSRIYEVYAILKSVLNVKEEMNFKVKEVNGTFKIIIINRK